MMNWFIKDRVLHATYRTKQDVPEELLHLADAYEGVIPKRVGWNLPFSFLKTCSFLPVMVEKALQTDGAEYLIVYPQQDIQTKKHELLHAQYGMNAQYRDEVHALWTSLSVMEQTKVRRILRSLDYPDREEILLDEFQAYYFTESPRFFGLSRSLTRSLSRSLAKKKSPVSKRK